MNIPFETIEWDSIPKTMHAGDSGTAWWQTKLYDGLRVRLVEYSNGYFANHWCQKGHVVYCIEGAFTSEMETGEKFFLKKGMMYVVSDDVSSHRSSTESGVKLLIIDGDFLK